jgi:predicted outer membrane protein
VQNHSLAQRATVEEGHQTARKVQLVKADGWQWLSTSQTLGEGVNSMRTVMVTTVMAILLLMGSQGVTGQERPQNQQRNPDVRSTASSGNIDKELANCLAIDNWKKIELAKFAESKTQSQDVKQFVEMLQKDHAEFVNRLKEIQPSVSSYVKVDGQHSPTERANLATGQPEQRNPAQPPSDRKDSPTTRDGQRPHTGADEAKFLQIKQEIATACVDTFRRELGGKTASEFDRCFLGYQVGAHLQMIDTLRVFERYASPQLAKVIADATQTAQGHLTQAKQLLNRYESKLTGAEKGTSEVK